MLPVPPPKKLPIDMMNVDTTKGGWGIFVEHIIETQSGRNVLVKIILEQMIDDERIRLRNLQLTVSSRDAHDPCRAQQIADRIRDWIESTEGDGFVDLV